MVRGLDLKDGEFLELGAKNPGQTTSPKRMVVDNDNGRAVMR